MLITMQLPLPPSVNRYWNSFRGRVFVSAAGKLYKKQVQEYIASNNVVKFDNKRLFAFIRVHPKDKRKFDIDNRLKSLLDALEDAGVFDNDEQFDEIYVSRGEIYKNGCVSVVIGTLED
jgi:crossover junction endodeoxyribonuclease RusA